MSASGITSINSGPLVIRTYLDNSSNNTYILGKYDIPVSTNYVLVTSTNGLLAPSDTIYLSNLSVSTFTASTVSSSVVSNKNLYGSTIYATNMAFSALTASSIIGSSIQGSNMSIDTTVNISTIQLGSVNTMNLTGTNQNQAVLNNLTVNTLFNVANANADLGTGTFTNLYGANLIRTNAISTTTVSTANTVTSFLYNSNLFSTISISTNTLSTVNLTYMSGSGSTITLNSMTSNSTINASTISTINLYLTSIVGTSFGNMNMTYLIVNKMLTGSTISIGTTSYSTMNGITATIPQLSMSVGSYSTIKGGTLNLSTLTASTVFVSSLTGSILACSTLTTSTLNANTMNVSSIMGSSMNITELFVPYDVYSTISGSMLTVSTTNASTIYASSMNGPLLGISSLFTSTMTGSTLIASTLTGIQMIASSIITSTMFQTSMNVSTFLIPNMTVSTAFMSTLNVSSINMSSINGITFGLGGGGITSNLSFGYGSLLLNTTGINNTAFGYNSLLNNTTGSNNSAFGVQSLYFNTSGSYNAAIGYNAGYTTAAFTGNYNTYIGHNAYPSALNVNNEIVIGGSHSGITPNIGIGSNTVTFGNANTAKTILYGAVGIGTNTNGSALNLYGSYQQIGGGVSINNVAASYYVAAFLFNDNTSGVGIFLNGSTRSADGGSYMGTLRNDNGMLRLQAKGGNASIAIMPTGFVGIGTINPRFLLDVVGGIRCIADGSVSHIEGNDSSIMIYAPNGLSSVASIWMGFDPTNLCGYINCARSGAIRHVCLQTRGGSVGIGGTTDSSVILDVYGTGHFTGNLTVGTTVTCGSLYINGIAATGNQWTGSGPISYGYGVQLTAGILTATSFGNLPLADNGGTAGMVKVGGGLTVSSGIISYSLPYGYATCSSVSAYGAGTNLYMWTLSSVSSNGITLGTYITGNSISVSAFTVSTSGYYSVDIYGYANTNVSWDYYIVEILNTGNRSPTARYPSPIIYPASYITDSYAPTSLSAILYITASSDNVVIYNTAGNSPSITMRIILTWISP